MKLTIQNGDSLTQIGIPYEGKTLSLAMHTMDVLSTLISKPIGSWDWESEYQFEIWDSQGISSWLVVNRDYEWDELEVYWVDEVVMELGISHKRNVGDIFKIDRSNFKTREELTQYMCYRYVNRTKIVGKPVSSGTQSWV